MKTKDKTKIKDKIVDFLKNNKLLILLNLVLIWAIVAFIIYPNLSLIKNTFITNGSVSFRAVEKLLSSERAMKSLVNSFILAVSLSITVNIFGIFIVLITEYFDIGDVPTDYCDQHFYESDDTMEEYTTDEGTFNVSPTPDPNNPNADNNSNDNGDNTGGDDGGGDTGGGDDGGNTEE